MGGLREEDRSNLGAGGESDVCDQPRTLVGVPFVYSHACCRGNASEILEEYLASIGGRENLLETAKNAKANKKRNRSTTEAQKGGGKRSKRNGEHPADSEPPESLKKEFRPPAGSWEQDVDIVDMFRDDNGALMVFLTWKNGHKTQHPAKQAYQRCPQKVCRSFFEAIRCRRLC